MPNVFGRRIGRPSTEVREPRTVQAAEWRGWGCALYGPGYSRTRIPRCALPVSHNQGIWNRLEETIPDALLFFPLFLAGLDGRFRRPCCSLAELP